MAVWWLVWAPSGVMLVWWLVPSVNKPVYNLSTIVYTSVYVNNVYKAMKQDPVCQKCEDRHSEKIPCRYERLRAKASASTAQTPPPTPPAISAASCVGCISKDELIGRLEAQIASLVKQVHQMNLELDAKIIRSEETVFPIKSEPEDKAEARRIYLRDKQRERRAALKAKDGVL